MKKVLKHAIMNALGTFVYVVAVVSVIWTLGQSFEGKESIINPILMLMLFVFSAALTGSLVFGRPILWYIDGRKKEALYLLVYTLGILLIIILLVFFFLVLRIS